MNAGEMVRLLGPYLGGAELSAEQAGQIGAYLELLAKWNARVNLTAVRGAEESVRRHFGESLFAARVLLGASAHEEHRPAWGAQRPLQTHETNPPCENRAGWGSPGSSSCQTERVIDVGSGAGFPGIPLRIWDAGVRLTLIESNHKKVAFLREVARTLGLSGVEVFAGRAEEFREKAELVTLRAVEKFDAVVPVAAALVADGGRLGLMIGAGQVERARELVPRFRWEDAVGVPEARERVVLRGMID